MARRNKKGQKQSWLLLLLTFFGARALIKKFGLDK